MSDYDKLMKIVDKEVVSVKELHYITNDELVAEVREHLLTKDIKVFRSMMSG